MHEATVQSSNQRVAVKMLKSDNESTQESFRKEADQLQGLEHRHVVRMLGSLFETAPYMIVMEFMRHGDLKTYLEAMRESRELELVHLVKLSLDVSSGFAYLQRNRYVHRDIAARNVLLGDHYEAKIGDFGMARRVFASEYYRQGASSTSWVLPLRWMAPESFTDGTWDLHTDVWMFGVLLWEIFSLGSLPWRGLADNHVIQNIQKRAKLEQPTGCPNEFYFDIMLSCWRLDPYARLGGADIERVVRQYVSESMVGRDMGSVVWPDWEVRQRDPADEMELGFELHGKAADEAVAALEVSAGSIEVRELLGEGAFGEVHKGVVVTVGGKRVSAAIKTIKGDSTAEMRRKFEDEARLFAMLKHANVVSCVALCLKAASPMIALELMQCDLETYLLQPNKYTVSEQLAAVMQVAEAMAYLESKRIVHRDLAARNVLVGFHGLSMVKLNDFGLSRTLAGSAYYRKTSKERVPVNWMAPESIINRTYSSASDVWSFGVLCWEVFEREAGLYAGMDWERVIDSLLDGYRLPKPKAAPDELYGRGFLAISVINDPCNTDTS